MAKMRKSKMFSSLTIVLKSLTTTNKMEKVFGGPGSLIPIKR